MKYGSHHRLFAGGDSKYFWLNEMILLMDETTICKVLYIPGGCFGFLPSTAFWWVCSSTGWLAHQVLEWFSHHESEYPSAVSPWRYLFFCPRLKASLNKQGLFTFTFILGWYERPLLFKLIWKAAFVWVTPYLVQLTFSLEACSWKNGDLVFQRWSFFSILETCMGIDDPYVKKPRWRRNWNAISKMIKDGLAEGMITRKLCVEVLDLVLTSFQTSFFSGHHE